MLNSMAGGSAIRFVRAKDIADLPVPIRSPEQQTKIRERHEEIVNEIEIAHQHLDQARQLNDSAFSE